MVDDGHQSLSDKGKPGVTLTCSLGTFKMVRIFLNPFLLSLEMGFVKNNNKETVPGTKVSKVFVMKE